MRFAVGCPQQNKHQMKGVQVFPTTLKFKVRYLLQQLYHICHVDVFPRKLPIFTHIVSKPNESLSCERTIAPFALYSFLTPICWMWVTVWTSRGPVPGSSAALQRMFIEQLFQSPKKTIKHASRCNFLCGLMWEMKDEEDLQNCSSAVSDGSPLSSRPLVWCDILDRVIFL